MKAILENNIRTLRENYAPLAAIPEDQLLRLMRRYELEPGDCIAFNGAQEECIFVLAGEIIQAGDGEETLLGPNNTLKRPVCLANSRSTFTATQPSVLGRINPARLDFLLSWESLRTDTGTDAPFHEWLGKLRNPQIFSQLPLENAQEVFRRLKPIEAGAGEVIFDMGEEAKQFYFIEKGRAELWRPELYEDKMTLTKILTIGDYFGEEALVTGGVRNARIRMIDKSRLLVLEKEDFDELINATMIERVTARVANAMLEEGARLLDVRYEEEFEMEYIPDCTLIPLLELRERVGELEQGHRYVVYCHSGKRSDVAAMILRQHKLQAVSLVGGIRDWPYEVVHPE